MSTALWRVRTEDARDGGRPIRFERLSQGIADGKWGESDQVLAPGEGQWRLVGEHPQLAEFVPHKALFRPRESEEADVDMTPMIDVTFQLLIFFMIAATYIVQKTLDMPKPEPSEEGTGVTIEQLQQNNIMVKVTRDGAITVNGTPAAVESLEQAIDTAAKAQGRAELVLDVHDDVLHELVVKIMDAAGAAKIEKVHFVSRAPPSGS
jgi:biopolymer transport protein ExbD